MHKLGPLVEPIIYRFRSEESYRYGANIYQKSQALKDYNYGSLLEQDKVYMTNNTDERCKKPESHESQTSFESCPTEKIKYSYRMDFA